VTTAPKDSIINAQWLADMMRANPPKILENGNVLSGMVRLAFPNLFKPRAASNNNQQGGDGGAGKFGAALLFPPGADMTLFSQVWTKAAREAFPQNWDPQGQPIGLHIPFHDQREKAFGVKPLAGYTPGAITFNVSSQFKPQVVDANMNPIVDEARVYAGVWAIVAMNVYKYGKPQPKTGIGFGMQSVMIVADDTKLGGGGSDPRKDFGGITISATSDVASKFGAAASVSGVPSSVMPSGGFVGSVGGLPVQALPIDDGSDLM